MIELTDENFQKEVLESGGHVLVDFYMEGCFPCQMIIPIIKKLSKEYKGRIVFTKAKLRNVPIYSEKYGVNSAPTIILFKAGKTVSGFIGYREEVEIKKWIELNIKN